MVGAIVLFVLAIAAAGFGWLVFEGAKSAIHEILGVLGFLVGAVFLAASLILSELALTRRKIIAQLKELNRTIARSGMSSNTAGNLQQMTE